MANPSAGPLLLFRAASGAAGLLQPEPLPFSGTQCVHFLRLAEPASACLGFDRAALSPGATLAGPAILFEDDTTTIVPGGFDVCINGLGHIVVDRAMDHGEKS